MSDSISIEQIVANANNYVKQLEGAKESAQAGFTKTEKLEDKKSELYQSIANDAYLVTLTQQMGEANARAATLKAANAAGVSDPQNPATADRLVTTMADMAQGQDAVRTDLINLKQKSEGKFLDDPLSWIKNNWFGGITETKQKLENDTALLNQSAVALTQLNQGVSAAATVNNHIKQTVTEASAQAAARMVANEANAKAIDAEIAGVRANIQGVQAVAQLSSEQLSAIFQAKSAVNAEKQLGITYANLTLSQEEFEWRKQEKAVADAARAEGKQIDDYTIEVINASRAARGLDPLQGVQAKAAIQVLKSGKSTEFAFDYENGSRIKATGQKSLIATSPGEAIEVLDKLRSTNIPEQMKSVQGVLKEAQTALAQAKNVDQKDTNARTAFLNNYVKQRTAQYYGAVTQDEHNPFFIGDVSSYFGMAAVKDLPVVSKVLGPAAALNQPLSDPKVVMGLVLHATQNGTITTSQAADLAKVYQVGTLVNQQAKRLKDVGIIPPNNGMNYNVKMDVLSSPVDLANSNQMARYINTQLAQRVGYGIGPKGTSADIQKYLKNASEATEAIKKEKK